MTRGKWLILLVIILGVGLLLAGCGGKTEPTKEPAPQEQVAEDKPAEEPKAEEPKEEPKVEETKEEPKVEEPKKEEPKVEQPKAEEPKKEEPKKEEPKAAPAPAPAGPPALNVKHTQGGMYESCATCHAGGNMFTSVKLPSSHGNLDGAFATCSNCHTLNFK